MPRVLVGLLQARKVRHIEKKKMKPRLYIPEIPSCLIRVVPRAGLSLELSRRVFGWLDP